MIAIRTPRNHARRVPEGIMGSSAFATADRTSGYGESSSANMSQKGGESGNRVGCTKPFLLWIEIRVVVVVITVLDHILNHQQMLDH